MNHAERSRGATFASARRAARSLCTALASIRAEASSALSKTHSSHDLVTEERCRKPRPTMQYFVAVLSCIGIGLVPTGPPELLSADSGSELGD
jgi:hypothetical protein